MRRTSQVGINLIKSFESLHDGNLDQIGLQPKLCPSGIYTVGWGHAVVDPLTNKFVTSDMPNGYERALELFGNMTEAQADELLNKDLAIYEQIVNRRVKIQINQNEFDALVSHTYNTGGSDTLFKLVNNGASKPNIYEWFTQHYITSNGVVLAGLIRRREAEAELFFEPIKKN